MPGAPHETMVVLLREHPDWLRALVEVIAKRKLPAKLALTDSAVRVVDPAEVRLDLVITADRAVAAWAQTVGRMKGPLGCGLAVEPVVVQLTGDVAELLLDPVARELHEKLLKLIREVSTMDSQKIPVSPALQRLGEEFQAMYGAQIEARGEVRGEAGALLKFLDARGFQVDEARRALVLGCEDVALLDRWIRRAASAGTIAEVFAE